MDQGMTMKPLTLELKYWHRLLVMTFALLGPVLAHADYDSYSNSYYGGYNSSYSPYGSSGVSTGPVISLELNSQETLNTSFRIAAREDRLDDVKRLLREGAELNSHSETGETALMYAARNCSSPIALLLIQAKANANLQDHQGRSALMYAAMDSCVPVVELLLDRCAANFRQKDRTGKTATDYAAAEAEEDVDGDASRVVEILSSTARKPGMGKSRS